MIGVSQSWDANEKCLARLFCFIVAYRVSLLGVVNFVGYLSNGS